MVAACLKVACQHPEQCHKNRAGSCQEQPKQQPRRGQLLVQLLLLRGRRLRHRRRRRRRRLPLLCTLRAAAMGAPILRICFHEQVTVKFFPWLCRSPRRVLRPAVYIRRLRPSEDAAPEQGLTFSKQSARHCMLMETAGIAPVRLGRFGAGTIATYTEGSMGGQTHYHTEEQRCRSITAPAPAARGLGDLQSYSAMRTWY